MAENDLNFAFNELARRLGAFGEAVKEKVFKQALQAETQKIVAATKRNSRVNTGLYRNSWFTNPIEIDGSVYQKKVGNSTDYASYLENGFRSHFVPGVWVGNQFRYDPNARSGFYMGPKGGYVAGDYTLKKATAKTEDRLKQYLDREIQRLGNEVMR